MSKTEQCDLPLEQIQAKGLTDPKELSLEAQTQLINMEKLKALQDQLAKELKELKERQELVAKLHNLVQTINNKTDKDNKVELSDADKELLKAAKAAGVDLKVDKMSYSNDERERFLQNIQMVVDDLNVKNDMQIQTVSRLNNERYESYQIARSVLEPLHRAKSTIARGIAGR